MALKSTKLPWVFIALTVLFLIALGIVLLCFDKGELHVALNAYHTPFLDYFMRFFTLIADVGVYIMAIALLCYKAGWSALLAANAAAATIVVQILKHIINAPRPLLWFQQNMPEVQLPIVDGVQMAYHFSCPSGHTITFFTLFFTLSWLISHDLTTPARNTPSRNTTSPLATLSRNTTPSLNTPSRDTTPSLNTPSHNTIPPLNTPPHNTTNTPTDTPTPKNNILSIVLQLLFFFFAITGAYSRIYLSMHFAFDIWCGAALALGICLACGLPFFYKLHEKPFWNWFLMQNTTKNDRK